MAIATIVYTMIDDQTGEATTEIDVPLGFSISQYTEFGAAMATLVDKLLAGKVSSAEICFGVDISALTFNTELGFSDVEEIGAFLASSVAGFDVEVNVPTLDESFIVPGGNTLDIVDPAVAAMVSLLENGLSVTGGTIIPCDVGESDLVSVLSYEGRTRATGTRR